MPNLAKVIKDEISRVARKELRTETPALKKASAHARSEIAALKRRLAALEKQIRQLARPARAAPAAATGEAGAEAGKLRFSAARLKAQRDRLGLSAAALGSLLQVSTQTIYNWEAGKTRPGASQLLAIAQVRKMGKKDVRAALERMGE